MPRTPAVSNGEVLGVRRNCAKLQATAHLQPPAGRPEQSLFSWRRCRPAGRLGEGSQAGEEQRKAAAVPALGALLRQFSFSFSSFFFSVL